MSVKVSVIGYGLSAKAFHIPFVLNTPGFALHSILQRTPRPDSDASKDYPSVKIVSKLEDVCSDPEVRLVVLTSANATHYPFAKALLEAGKDVLVEKPFTVTSAHADELVALAKKHNRLLTVYQNRRFDADFKTLHKLLTASPSPLGAPVALETHYDRFKALEAYEKDTTGPKKWKTEQDPASGNGTLFDLGAHIIDQVLALFGVPDRVFGIVKDERGASLDPKAQWGEPGFLDDFFSAVFYYDGPRKQSGRRLGVAVPERGLIVKLEASTLSLREQQLRFIVRGSQGGFVKYGTDPQESQVVKEGLGPKDNGFGIESSDLHGTLTTASGDSSKVTSEPGTYVDFYTNLAAALEGKAEPEVTPEEGRDTIRMIELIAESNRTGKVVRP